MGRRSGRRGARALDAPGHRLLVRVRRPAQRPLVGRSPPRQPAPLAGRGQSHRAGAVHGPRRPHRLLAFRGRWRTRRLLAWPPLSPSRFPSSRSSSAPICSSEPAASLLLRPVAPARSAGPAGLRHSVRAGHGHARPRTGRPDGGRRPRTVRPRPRDPVEPRPRPALRDRRSWPGPPVGSWPRSASASSASTARFDALRGGSTARRRAGRDGPRGLAARPARSASPRPRCCRARSSSTTRATCSSRAGRSSGSSPSSASPSIARPDPLAAHRRHGCGCRSPSPRPSSSCVKKATVAARPAACGHRPRDAGARGREPSRRRRPATAGGSVPSGAGDPHRPTGPLRALHPLPHPVRSARRPRGAAPGRSTASSRRTDREEALAIARSLGAALPRPLRRDRVRFDPAGVLEPVYEEAEARVYRFRTP